MIEIKPDSPFFSIENVRFLFDTSNIVFLAGSIEMGLAENWQKKVVDKLINTDIIILNPRRDNWDASWEQSTSNPEFVEQVKWELAGINLADKVLFYFDPATKSPISLMELGLCIGKMAFGRVSNVFVCCPEGYWKKGNVDILCEKYGVKVYSDLNQMLLDGFVA